MAGFANAAAWAAAIDAGKAHVSTFRKTVASAAAMDKMMADMMVPYTGDPDIDFARGMIPHHQGAIDMAKVGLEHGTDPETKALAEAIIAAQEQNGGWLTDELIAESLAARKAQGFDEAFDETAFDEIEADETETDKPESEAEETTGEDATGRQQTVTSDEIEDKR